MQVLCNFYENVDMSMIRSIWSPWRNEKGWHGSETEMVPRQHIGFGSSRRYRCKRSGRERVMQGWWGDPGYRVSHMTVARKRVTACDEQVGHSANASNSYNTCISSRAVVLGGYTFEACVSRRFKNVEGSSRSRVVVEVVVHVS